MRDGKLYAADLWKCHHFRIGPCPILVSVISIPRQELNVSLIYQLEAVAFGFQILNGPIHFEILKTDLGYRLIKFTPRFANGSLTALCKLADIPSQIDLFWELFVAPKEDGAYEIASGNKIVADYAFIDNYCSYFALQKLTAKIVNLDAFSHYHHHPTQNYCCWPDKEGHNYVATIFLKHHQRQIVMKTINSLNKLAFRSAGNEDILCRADAWQSASKTSSIQQMALMP